MTARQVALPTAVVAFVAGAWSYFPTLAARVLDEPVWLSFSMVFLGGSLVAVALNPGAILGAAYWASAGTDVSREWSAFAAWTFVGAVVGYLGGGLFGVAVLSALAEHPGFARGTDPYYSVVYLGLYDGLRAAVAGIAGASIGHFRLN